MIVGAGLAGLPGVAIAGDGTSAISPGYVDGAVRSGLRAAAEVRAALSSR